MKKTLTLLIATTALTMYGAAYAASDSYKAETTVKQDNGNVTKDVSVDHTDVNGTEEKSEVKTKLNVSNNGDTSKEVTTEHVTDPKGLMNKNTVSTTETEKTKNGVTTHHFKKKVNGNTVVNTKSDTDTTGNNTGY